MSLDDESLIPWQSITPADAVDYNLHRDLHVTAPLNEMGERCPWPWEPQQLVGAPLGQYHCGYCGAMVMAGMEHLDYTDWDDPADLTVVEFVDAPPEEPGW